MAIPGYIEIPQPDEPADKAQVVVFDFDETTLDGSSTARLVRYLILHFMLNPIVSLQIGFWGFAYKYQLPQNESWVRGKVFSAFKNKTVEEVDKFLGDFFEQALIPIVRPKALERMREHKEAGDTVVIVSASFEPIVLRALETCLHSVDGQVSTRMKIAPDGKHYLCEVDGLPVEGEEKIRAVKRWCDEHFGKGGWELKAAYGDHQSDVALLEAARHAYAVTPNQPLERYARSKGWPILEW